MRHHHFKNRAIVCVLIVCLIGGFVLQAGWKQDTSLAEAICAGNLASVQDALDAGADANKMAVSAFPIRKCNAYDYACDHLANVQIPDYLLSYVDIDHTSRYGTTILMRVAAAGSLEHCLRILEYEPDVNIRKHGKGFSALDYAAFRHHNDVVQCLIAHGAEVTDQTIRAATENLPDERHVANYPHAAPSAYLTAKIVAMQLMLHGDDTTLDPLIEAAMRGDSASVIAILQEGNDTEDVLRIASYYIAGFCNDDALAVCIQKGVPMYTNIGINELLLTYFAAAYGNVETLDYLIQYARTHHKSTRTNSLLTVAVQGNQFDTTAYLLSCEDADAASVLSDAIIYSNLSVFQLLFESVPAYSDEELNAILFQATTHERKDILAYILPREQFSQEQLSQECRYALTSGDIELLSLLCDYGATPEEDNHNLQVAVQYGCYDMVKFLLERGADVHADSDAALQYAVLFGFPDIVELLVNHGADINCADQYGVSPLMRAAESSNHITDYFIEKGADVNARDTSGSTALMYAAGAGKEHCVKALLDAGADPDAKDQDGHSVSGYARRGHHPEIIKLLKRAS